MSALEDDKLEVLEFYIGLLQERVENLKKESSNNREQLTEFMSEYIDLEDKILNLMQKLSQCPIENNQTMEELTNTFNKYWSDYQDTWSDDYWEVYNMFRHIDDKELFFQMNKKAFNNSSQEENLEKMEETAEKKIKSPVVKVKDKAKTGSTHDESCNMTLVNLNKIDEEMEKVGNSSIFKEKKEEKRRTCLDCAIF